MRKLIPLVTVGLAVLSFVLLMSTARSTEATSFNWRDWVPTFIYDYFFEENPGEPQSLVGMATPLDPAIAALEASTLTQARSSEWPATTLDRKRELVNRQAAATAMTLLADDRQQIPLSTSRPFQLLLPEQGDFAAFEDFAARYAPFGKKRWRENDSLDELSRLPSGTPVVVLIDDSFGAPSAEQPWWESLSSLKDNLLLIFVHFGPLEHLVSLPQGIIALQLPLGDGINQEYAAQALFGAQPISGRLATPVGIRFPAGTGLMRSAVRLGYTAPELMGIDREALLSIDQTMNWACRQQVIPGGQVLVAKGGQIVYEKAFGYQTYQRRISVRVSDLYDLASITKSAATTLSLMKLYDGGLIRLEDRLGQLVPAYAEAPTRKLRLDQLLAHHTGLQANIPANDYLGRYDELFASERSDAYPVPVGPNRFVSKDVIEGIQKNIRELYPARKPFYQYSDANFALLRDVVESTSQRTLDEYLRGQFTEPLGLRRLGFNPAYLYPADHLVPAGVDNWMRGGELRGFVHDESAALLGGVSGHAGLFSDALDLAQLFQMLLNRGRYADQSLLRPETVDLFTQRNTYNHRALGFELLKASHPSVVDAGASEATFGHTGFVGTCVWADPEHDLVYIFLSNRTYPDGKNSQLIKRGIRERVHRIIYRSLNTYRPEAA